MNPLSSSAIQPVGQAASVQSQRAQGAVQAAQNSQIAQAASSAINQGGAARASNTSNANPQARTRPLPDLEALRSNSNANAHRMGVNAFGGIRKPPEQKLLKKLVQERERLEMETRRAEWQVAHPAEYAAQLNAIAARNEAFWNQINAAK